MRPYPFSPTRTIRRANYKSPCIYSAPSGASSALASGQIRIRRNNTLRSAGTQHTRLAMGMLRRIVRSTFRKGNVQQGSGDALLRQAPTRRKTVRRLPHAKVVGGLQPVALARLLAPSASSTTCLSLIFVAQTSSTPQTRAQTDGISSLSGLEFGIQLPCPSASQWLSQQIYWRPSVHATDREGWKHQEVKKALSTKMRRGQKGLLVR